MITLDNPNSTTNPGDGSHESDGDDASSSSETTLGGTSVDLLLGLRSSLPLSYARQRSGLHDDNTNTNNRNDANSNTSSNANRVNGTATVDNVQTPKTKQSLSTFNTSTSTMTPTTKPAPSSSKGPHETNEPIIKPLNPCKSPSPSPSLAVSPPTQTFNELSQLSTGNGSNMDGDNDSGNNGNGEHPQRRRPGEELMFDMSQLSQISVPDAGNVIDPDDCKGKNDKKGSGNGNKPVTVNNSGRALMSHSNAGVISNSKAVKDCINSHRTESKPKSEPQSKKDRDGEKGEDEKVPSKFLYITLRRLVSFGMNITEVYNSSNTKKYCCVSNVKTGGQAEFYGLKKGDLLYHPPDSYSESGHESGSRDGSEGDLELQNSKDELKPFEMDEVVELSKSLVRPVTLVVERLTGTTTTTTALSLDESESESSDSEVEFEAEERPKPTIPSQSASVRNDSRKAVDAKVPKPALQCSLTRPSIIRALNGKGYPKVPCCRKCNNSSMYIRNHHFLCPKHQDFDHSGSKEKLIILMAGALYDCEACIHELENGRKNSKLVHNTKCEQSTRGSSRTKTAGAATVAKDKKVRKRDKLGRKSSATTRKVNRKASAIPKKGSGGGRKNATEKTINSSSGKPNQPDRKRKSEASVTQVEQESPSRKRHASQNSGSAGCTEFVAAKATSTLNPRPKRVKKTGEEDQRNSLTSAAELKKDTPTFYQRSEVNKKRRAVDKDQRTQLINTSESKMDGVRAPAPTQKRGINHPRATAQVTPILRSPAPEDKTHDDNDMPMFLTDETSVSKWVPCPNPWGDRAYRDGDFVLFSPDDYASAFEVYGSSPRRFVRDPFKSKASPYYKSHCTQEEGGFRVLQLSRDRLARRSWGFRFCCHDFGEACLVTEVEPLSPADSAQLVGSGAQDAPLRLDDMIICVNNKNVGGMTEIELGVELDMSGPHLSLVISRCRKDSNLQHEATSQSSLCAIDPAESLHWNEIGERAILESSEQGKDVADEKVVSESEKGDIDVVFRVNHVGNAEASEEDPSENVELETKDSEDEASESSLMNTHEKFPKPSITVADLCNIAIEDVPEYILPIKTSGNKNGYQGIRGRSNGWAVNLRYKGKSRLVGCYESKEDAGRVYAWIVYRTRGKGSLCDMYKSQGLGRDGQYKRAIDLLSLQDAELESQPRANTKNEDAHESTTNELSTTTSAKHASEYMVPQQGPVRDGCDKGPSEFNGQNRTHGGVMSDTGEYIETNPSDLKVQDLPQHIKPIKSVRNKYGYEGIDNKTDRGWKVKLYLKKNRYYFLGPFDCLEIAAKMYAWACLIYKGEEALQERYMQKCLEAKDAKGSISDAPTVDEIGSERGQDFIDDLDGSSRKNTKASPNIRMRQESSKTCPNVQANSDEEPEWDDDSNPWLGCVCGETHESPIPVFWIQCDSCDAWFNCMSECVGFSKAEAEGKSDWKCPDCAPPDRDYSVSRQNKTPPKTMRDFSEDEQGECTSPIPVDTVVDVEDRTWPGSNLPGGVAKVQGFQITNDEIFYDIRYVLERRVEKNVAARFISVNHQIMMTAFASPRSTRSSDKTHI